MTGCLRPDFFQILCCQMVGFCQSPREQPAMKGGEILVKLIKVLAALAFAAATLSLGACMHNKSQAAPPPPPPTVGTYK